MNRYGQLTYTCFDVAGTAGGWQVKQTSGDLTPQEIDELVAGVRTVFRAVEPLPTYPTPQDCERGPRRLAYRPVSVGAAFWHTVPAGSDATGRPGNVFAHVLLDRIPAERTAVRPIQLWRSPDWVRPYGAPEVARAMLPSDQPVPGGVVTADSAVDFVMDTSTWRLGTLCGLLDATAAALQGGPPVVLGVDSPESAAQWIGLTSFLMSAGTAARLSFSTFDRSDEVSPDVHTGHHLTAVPRGDLASLPPQVVIIDEASMLSLGELDGEPHRTASGQIIEVTPWSAMAQVVLTDPASARVVLADIDRYAEVAGDRDLHPAWPMAMSVLHRDDFADARAEATIVITAHCPSEMPSGSPLGQRISDAMAELVGFTTEEAWRAVERVNDGQAADYADAIYLERAIADHAWLRQQTPVPVSPRRYDDRDLPDAVASAIGAAVGAGGESDPEVLIRLADLLLRSGVDDDVAAQVLSQPVVHKALTDPGRGPEVARRVGHRVGHEVRLALAARILAETTVTADRRTLPDIEVLAWLAEGVGVPDPRAVATAKPWDSVWTRTAVRGACAESQGAHDDADRFAHLWWCKLRQATLFDEVAGDAIWHPTDLLIASHGAPLSARAALPTLLGAPDSSGMSELAASVMDTSPDPVAVACAALRGIETAEWVQDGLLHERQGVYSRSWEEAMTDVGLGGVHPDAGVRVLTLSLLADIRRIPFPLQANTIAADARTADAAVWQILELVDRAVVDPAAVLAAALLPVATDEDSADAASVGVSVLVARVADQLVAGRRFSEEDVDATVSLMTRMAGLGADQTPRRYRKMVHKLLAQGRPGQISQVERIRGGH